MKKGNNQANSRRLGLPIWILYVLCIGSLVVSIVSITRSNKTIRLGYVKTGELISNYKGFKEGEELLQEKHQRWQANADTLESQFSFAVSEYYKRSPTLSLGERQRQENLLAVQERQKSDYMEGVQKRAQQEQQIVMDTIITHTNTYVKKYAKSHGYDFIFGTTNDGSLLYGNEADDLTSILTEEMNKVYIKGSLFHK